MRCLGAGTYGAVVYPAKPCVGRAAPPGSVSKAFYTVAQADTEYQDATRLLERGIPVPAPLGPPCTMSAEDAAEVAAVCRRDAVTTTQLWFKHGGMALYKWAAQYAGTAPNMYRGAFHVLDTLLLLREKHALHGDIKSDNILVQDDGSWTLIDYNPYVRAYWSTRSERDDLEVIEDALVRSGSAGDYLMYLLRRRNRSGEPLFPQAAIAKAMARVPVRFSKIFFGPELRDAFLANPVMLDGTAYATSAIDAVANGADAERLVYYQTEYLSFVDTFALGATIGSIFRHDLPGAPKILAPLANLVANMMNPSPFRRWNVGKCVEQLALLTAMDPGDVASLPRALPYVERVAATPEGGRRKRRGRRK